MAMSFPRVGAVAKGDEVTSAQYNALAGSWNARLLGGIGDPTWRIFFYVWSMLRQMRNPSVEGLFPSEGEFFEFYQNVDPAEDFFWPEVGGEAVPAGEPEGANLANILNVFMFGSLNAGIDAEDVRMDLPTGSGTGRNAWDAHTSACGAMDPSTGAWGSPVWTAAREGYAARQRLTSPHGNGWGGMLPTAPWDQVTFCGPPIERFPSYTFFFTNLVTHEVRSFNSCVDGTAYGIFEYTVYTGAGAVVHLPYNQWVEGPYTGAPVLRKTAGNVVAWFISAYVKLFRGNAGNGEAGSPTDQTKTFAAEEFYARQYLLAPQRGVEDGMGHVTGVETVFQVAGAGTYTAGAALAVVAGGSGAFVVYPSGWCFSSGLLAVTGLAVGAGIVVGLYDDTKLIQTVSLTAATAGEEQSLVFIVPTCPTPGALNVRLLAAVTLTGPGAAIEVRPAVQVKYLPVEADAYVVLRMASGSPILTNGLDGSGVNVADAKALADGYFKTAALTGQGLPEQLGVISTNGVYDAVRQMSKCARSVRRLQIVDYALDPFGRSVIWFRRLAQGTRESDSFSGIGPRRAAVTRLYDGIEYQARGGSVTYPQAGHPGSVVRAIGTNFHGIYGEPNYDGPGAVWEVEGIILDPIKEGVTNRWAFEMDLKVYQNSGSNPFKPSSYADIFTRVNRCLVGSTEVTPDTLPDVLVQTQYGQNGMTNPESPSGYNYVHGINGLFGAGHSDDLQQWFWKSCRIYEPAVEVLSVTDDAGYTATYGEPVVKVVFAQRLHHCEDAAGAINPGVANWDITNLRNQGGGVMRSWENGIMDYLAFGLGGIDVCPERKAGDVATDSRFQENQGVYGACFPQFFFTQLIPEVYEDDPPNTKQDGWDTPIKMDGYQQMALYTQAACSGFIDGATTTGRSCGMDAASYYDFSFEELCAQAFGQRSLGLMSLAKRPDRPDGHGPLPGMVMEAEMYNRLASCLNLMHRARVMLPNTIACNQQSWYGETGFSPAWTRFTGDFDCSTTDAAVFGPGTPAGAGTLVNPGGEYGACGNTDPVSISSNTGASIPLVCSGVDGKSWKITTTKTTLQYKFGLANLVALNAIPESWRDMVSGGIGVGLLGHKSVMEFTTEVHATPAGQQASGCGQEGESLTPDWFHGEDGSSYQYSTVMTVISDTCEFIPGSGTVDAGVPPSGTFVLGITPSNGLCVSGTARVIGITVFQGDTFYVDIPLV